jgi:hypothetical protein
LGAAALHAGAPPKDLNARAREIAKRELKNLGEGYTSKIDRQRHLIFISALDETHLKETSALLSSFHDGLRQTMGAAKSKWNITIILPTVEDFPKLVSEENVAGVYYQKGRRLVALDRGDILLHEFTHALHDADASGQQHPIWVAEGLATLFESAEVTAAGLEPRVDTSVYRVQEAIDQRRTIPLEKLLANSREAFASQTALAYAQSHYVMYYLYDQDKLRGFYRRLKEGYRKDPDGVKAFEHALSGRVSRIDEEWQRWAKKLRPTVDLGWSRRARLGAIVRAHKKGAEVVSLIRRSSAKRAGRLRVGDVITKFNGTLVAKPDDLYAAIRAAGGLQTVEIELLRNGRAIKIRQPLGAPDKP